MIKDGKLETYASLIRDNQGKQVDDRKKKGYKCHVLKKRLYYASRGHPRLGAYPGRRIHRLRAEALFFPS